MLAQNHNQVEGTHSLFACGISDQQSIACTKPASGWGNSRPIGMRHLGSAIYCLHKTTISLRELTPYLYATSWISNLLLAQNQHQVEAASRISNLLLAQNQHQVEGTHLLFACGISAQESRLRELTLYSHAASRISNLLLAQNQHQVRGTHLLFACGILDQQSIARTKPQSGRGNSLAICMRHLRSAMYCLHKITIR